VTNIIQITLYNDIFTQTVFLSYRQALSQRLAVEYSRAVIYNVLRLSTEYFTKVTVYCKIKRFDIVIY